ncbi:HET domain protein pin-c2 [Pyrenophora teres f. teres]|uniref:HET domain protein pin-c2 n=1 Tax=Pyrenophora teres f. teres TaxID=97479 RepID=A0A6S6WD75_9PLEO|nr:HET domain protein pin-c2 [Pyrenophora teres f. teres]
MRTVPFTTTIATFRERRERILFVQLTKTFQEAVQTTRALGIRYLWIDSLCIIQGDPDDWAREASQMSLVYQNALITIAAAASKSGDECLFRKYLSHDYKVNIH